jgi:dipeptidyl-peptidase 4
MLPLSMSARSRASAAPTRARCARFRHRPALAVLLLGAVLPMLGAVLPALGAAHPATSDLPGFRAVTLSAQETGPATLTHADYRRAEAFLSWNVGTLTHRTSVSPNWLDDERFWYRLQVPGGHEFIRVNAGAGTRERAFDHARLASALSMATGEAYEALRLPFTSFEEVEAGRAIEVQAGRRLWRCDLADYRCEERTRPEAGPAGIASPDGRLVAFRRDDDLWVFNRDTGEETRLTEDGEERYGYATDSQGWRTSELPILLWSPDSRRIATFRLDERDVEEMHLVRTAEPRPEVRSWPYALPGDTIVPMLERVVIDVEARRVVELDTPPDHQRASSCCGLLRGQAWADVEWSTDGETLAFVSTSRDYSTVTLRIADPGTGAVRTVFEETLEPFFESSSGGRGVPNWRVLHDRGEFLWFSQRDGWGHLYRYDLETGAEVGRVTAGAWNVLDVLAVDEAAGQIVFTALGREEGRDPYLRHLYRIGLDGSGVRLLTPEEADHGVSLSPDARWVVDTWSTVDTAPVSALRRASDGEVVLPLEEGDISELEALGWRAPRPFTARARDGVTEVYGLLVLPSHFDPEKRYPIINAIYPGPQAGSVGTRSFATSRRGQAHALAELGFVVVLIDAMGNPERSRAFHTYYYGDMGDNGLPDQIAAMRDLARRHDWIDLDRVGIFGHSGGGFATAAALLRHPDFFHVGVAGAGNHDNRGYTYYWGEKWQGPLEENEDGDSYENQANHLLADRLEGKLLLTYGTMDANVHPNTTLLLIDALIRENKDFDVMVFPNRGHGYSNEPYNVRITWDYFVRHLMGKEPPAGFRFDR